MEGLSLLSEPAMARRLQSNGRPVRPSPPYVLIFPSSLVRRATDHLRRFGQKGLEQLVLWGGYPVQSGVVVASLLLPETEVTWGSVRILPPEQPKIASWLHTHGQLLFAEAHTHGDGPWATRLSPEDRRHPAGRQDGFVTIIVPGYARSGIDFSRAGIWECQALDWTRLPSRQVRRRLLVKEDEEARSVLA